MKVFEDLGAVEFGSDLTPNLLAMCARSASASLRAQRLNEGLLLRQRTHSCYFQFCSDKSCSVAWIITQCGGSEKAGWYMATKLNSRNLETFDIKLTHKTPITHCKSLS